MALHKAICRIKEHKRADINTNIKAAKFCLKAQTLGLFKWLW